MKLSGVAAGHANIREIEDALRDKQHRILGKGGTEDQQLKDLKWRFDEDVEILPVGAATTPVPTTKTAPKIVPAKQGGAR